MSFGNTELRTWLTERLSSSANLARFGGQQLLLISTKNKKREKEKKLWQSSGGRCRSSGTCYWGAQHLRRGGNTEEGRAVTEQGQGRRKTSPKNVSQESTAAPLLTTKSQTCI